MNKIASNCIFKWVHCITCKLHLNKAIKNYVDEEVITAN